MSGCAVKRPLWYVLVTAFWPERMLSPTEADDALTIVACWYRLIGDRMLAALVVYLAAEWIAHLLGVP